MRKLLVVALLVSACSWDAEKPDIQVQVDGISSYADHLDVTVTTSAGSATYKPQFQPQDAGAPDRSIALSLAAPGATGAYTVDIIAADRTDSPIPNQHGLAAGTLPGVSSVEVTLH